EIRLQHQVAVGRENLLRGVKRQQRGSRGAAVGVQKERILLRSFAQGSVPSVPPWGFRRNGSLREASKSTGLVTMPSISMPSLLLSHFTTSVLASAYSASQAL